MSFYVSFSRVKSISYGKSMISKDQVSRELIIEHEDFQGNVHKTFIPLFTENNLSAFANLTIKDEETSNVD